MTQDNRLWILMSRYLSRHTSPEEEKELRDLLEQSPGRQYLFDILHSYFIDLPPAAISRSSDPDLEERFQKIMKMPENRSFFHKKWKSTAATIAAVAACLLLGWGIYRLKPAAPPPQTAHPVRSEEILARAGTRTKLLLPDGTQVWLNSSSRLKYTSDFNSKNREVVLEGEAYFDVAKDFRLPFIVHAATIDIKVLGTSFDVKSYPQDETIEATLLKGTIEISRKDIPGTARVILKPNEKLVFSKSFVVMNRAGASSVIPAVHPALAPDMAVGSIRPDIPDSDKVETAWLYNRLVFDGDNFKELAGKMERWFNVRITIRDSSLINYHFGGIFEKETLQQALKELQLTRNFGYKIDGNEIELYAKE
jgi:transmembrane sensor